RLALLNIKTVADLQAASLRELVHELGESIGNGLYRLAYADDDRPVQVEHDAKSISVEDTFPEDLTVRAEIEAQLDADADVIAKRLTKSGVFARTISIKVRLGDFSTHTRSRTLEGATDRAERLAGVARQLLAGVDVARGVRLIGLGTSGFTTAAQEELFADDENAPVTEEVQRELPPRVISRHAEGWHPGEDVRHEVLGRGWVWGCGHGRVTIRFESRLTGVGRVRTFKADDPALAHEDPLPMAWDHPVVDG
ncbi:MAG: DNA polymerase IV, partial [Propionibacteriaceae bacterium]|nr:DNA polymerase IV [Propionibacteriaceae bacterium]